MTNSEECKYPMCDGQTCFFLDSPGRQLSSFLAYLKTSPDPLSLLESFTRQMVTLTDIASQCGHGTDLWKSALQAQVEANKAYEARIGK